MSDLKIAFGMIVFEGDYVLEECLQQVYPYAEQILIAEGPVEGLCDATGGLVSGIDILKGIYFDKPTKSFDESYDWGLKSSLILSSILILIYFIYPSILTSVVYSIIIY